MSKQQLQADMADSRQEDEEVIPTEAEKQADDAAWNETLNSPESLSFLDAAIAKGLKELDNQK